MNILSELSCIRLLTFDEVDHIQKGAYVIVEDRGQLYRKFAEKGIIRMWSEHKSSNAVYDIPGKVGDEKMGNVLVGLRKTGHTWVQWERSPCCSLAHVIDWCWFICKRQNQGPYGQSCHTEHNPILLNSLVIDM